MFKLLVKILITACPCLPAMLMAAETATLKAVRAEKISIDGNLTEKCWQQAVPATDFEGVMNTKDIEQQTLVRVLYDNESLYVGAELKEPLVKELGSNGSVIWADDRLEIILAPDPQKAVYFLFAINCEGATEEGCFGSAEFNDAVGEYNASWSATVSKGENSWFLEARIPYAALELEGLDLADSWRVNFCRQRSPGTASPKYSAWVPKFGGFHYAGGDLHFQK